MERLSSHTCPAINIPSHLDCFLPLTCMCMLLCPISHLGFPEFYNKLFLQYIVMHYIDNVWCNKVVWYVLCIQFVGQFYKAVAWYSCIRLIKPLLFLTCFCKKTLSFRRPINVILRLGNNWSLRPETSTIWTPSFIFLPFCSAGYLRWPVFWYTTLIWPTTGTSDSNNTVVSFMMLFLHVEIWTGHHRAIFYVYYKCRKSGWYHFLGNCKISLLYLGFWEHLSMHWELDTRQPSRWSKGVANLHVHVFAIAIQCTNVLMLLLILHSG